MFMCIKHKFVNVAFKKFYPFCFFISFSTFFLLEGLGLCHHFIIYDHDFIVDDPSVSH
ncbi:hypothetical protein MtrunA17_Chr5g0429041 [Medicago truncatula]|uniref:Transmembrane protein n=1 Tax=Medicago truncatula TaxID=3880 RepID=A0A396HSQ8_MEDTR|nr:hypothetical protein MtrunA17_Chr5g0429041 [Medicago truncatula]